LSTIGSSSRTAGHKRSNNMSGGALKRTSAGGHGRAERTRQKLLRAFVDLVMTRGSLQISPADVAARAGVRRSTLYTHFGGRLELLEASLMGPCTALAGAVRVGSSPSELLPLLHHLQSQSARTGALLRDPLNSLWAKCLARAIATTLREDRSGVRHRPTIPHQLLAPVLAEVQLAIIRCWLENPAGVNAEMLAATLSASTRRLLSGG